MVKLLASEVRTREILDWKGIHLFHAAMSSCSQKTRIFLNLKGIEWTSHIVDLGNGQNHTPWYLGINPRGLVPVLVDDGEVHIESNDILLHMESKFPEPPLLPSSVNETARDLLDLEDEMHMDLRTLTFRYLKPRGPGPMKDPGELAVLAAHDGTVAGKADTQRAKEVAFWEAANLNDGITDDQVRVSTAKFVAAFKRLDEALASHTYVLGDTLSVADIAWFIYTNRLNLAGYPLGIHPHLKPWFEKLTLIPEFAKEIALPPPAVEGIQKGIAAQSAKGGALLQVAADCFA